MARTASPACWLAPLLLLLGCPPPSQPRTPATPTQRAANPAVDGVWVLELEAGHGYPPGLAAQTKPAMRGPDLSAEPLLEAVLPTGPQRWSVIEVAGNRFPFVIVGEGSQARLWIDLDQDGDLGDEEPQPGGNDVGYGASLKLPVVYETGTRVLPVWFFVSFERGRFDFYAQGHWEGELRLGQQSFVVYTFEIQTDGDFSDHPVWIDVNGDGTLQAREQVSHGESVTLGQETLRLDSVSTDGAAVTFRRVEGAGRDLAAEVQAELRAHPFLATAVGGERVEIGTGSLGKVVLLDFWATWCGPCMAEMPHVKAIWERHGQREDFLLVGVSFDSNLEALERVAARDGLAWPHICDGQGDQGPVAQAYGVTGIPATILIDRQGVIRARGLRGDALSAKLEALLAE